MIEMKDVSKKFTVKKKKRKMFGRSSNVDKVVISNINLTISKGSIIGLLGINGAGKTTTIKMLSTLLAPTEGEILIDGMNISSCQELYKNKINLISGGEKNLFWRLTARENLEYFASLYGIGSKDANKIISEVLKVVQLEDSIDIPVEKFSKGMKQRLQIAKGLINEPDYIFLDEPTLGLDIIIAKELRSYIKRLATEENKGILLTSHYLHEVEELCDYIYVLEDGVIKIEGAPSQVISLLNKIIKTQIKFEERDPSLENQLLNSSKINKVEWLDDNTLEIVSEKEIISDLFGILGVESFEKVISISGVKPTLEESLILSWEENNESKVQHNIF
ncbi:putative ABC transporter ATP-binding protein YbhF [Streptococcus sanguinis]|uniref:ABC transporter ATP-binding protein YbhF n=1 Tax=Streptococcus sanguinis TaxID=1305 RepID=A0AB74DTL6_STRSA|nr:ABC transporter ATP-binding protein [Streptococcus sanguinis]RSI14240.1 putative ABC transporter ATP-binding protein YbhF [Streptococcus sanguinis]RSI50948.1 putative ABC transporter ATP-binding protein YbhF [Streptococcus sanguinis]